MPRSSRPWKFKIVGLTNASVVVGAMAPASGSDDERSVECLERLKLMVRFDQEPMYSLTLDHKDQEITLPLSTKGLPREISFVDALDGRALSSPLKAAKLFTCGIRSLSIDNNRVIGVISSSIGLPCLPIEVSLPDGRVFADGNAHKSEDDGREYYVDLPVKYLMPLTAETRLGFRIFGRAVLTKLSVSAQDIGIVGYVDVASSKGIVGWVCNISTLDSVLVTLRVDGAPLTTTLADQPRPDLKAWGIKNTKSGFAFSKEIIARIPKNAETSVTVGDPGIHLVNSPLKIAQ